jgi:hypothetical protein
VGDDLDFVPLTNQSGKLLQGHILAVDGVVQLAIGVTANGSHMAHYSMNFWRSNPMRARRSQLALLEDCFQTR